MKPREREPSPRGRDQGQRRVPDPVDDPASFREFRESRQPDREIQASFPPRDPVFAGDRPLRFLPASPVHVQRLHGRPVRHGRDVRRPGRPGEGTVSCAFVWRAPLCQPEPWTPSRSSIHGNPDHPDDDALQPGGPMARSSCASDPEGAIHHGPALT